MFAPDFSSIIAVCAIFVALATTLFALSAKRHLLQNLKDMRQEGRANHSATYGLARHLRKIQTQVDQGGQRRGDTAAVTLKKADQLVDQGMGSLELADQLGVSQNEAEIIRHLRPVRSQTP